MKNVFENLKKLHGYSAQLRYHHKIILIINWYVINRNITIRQQDIDNGHVFTLSMLPKTVATYPKSNYSAWIDKFYISAGQEPPTDFPAITIPCNP